MLRPEETLPSATAQRSLTEADLIRRGATINQVTGRLVLGEALLEYVDLIDNRRHNRWTQFEDEQSYEPPHDEWLDSVLIESWQPRATLSRAPGVLRRAGIVTPRDILVLGRDYINSGAVPGAGVTTTEAIEELVADNPHGLTWEKRPTPEFIAGFCHHLREVSGRTLGIPDLPQELTVLDVVRLTGEERLFVGTKPGRHVSDEQKDHIYNHPDVFAVRFYEAQSREV